MIEKFTFDVQAPKVKKKIILVKNESEQRAHVVMKLLSYILFFDQRLKIEAAVDFHYKPDLVIAEDGRNPELWIDCGAVSLKKVEKLSGKLRTTRIILVKKTISELKRFRKTVEKKVETKGNLEYFSFEAGFVDDIAAALEKTNQVTLYNVMEDTVGVVVNETLFESKLYSVKEGDDD